MEVTRRNLLTKVGITPIETTQEIQKSMQQQKGETIALGLLSAFEAGVIITMGMMTRRKKCNQPCQLKTGVRYCDPDPASEEFFDEEDN